MQLSNWSSENGRAPEPYHRGRSWIFQVFWIIQTKTYLTSTFVCVGKEQGISWLSTSSRCRIMHFSYYHLREKYLSCHTKKIKYEWNIQKGNIKHLDEFLKWTTTCRKNNNQFTFQSETRLPVVVGKIPSPLQLKFAKLNSLHFRSENFRSQ